MTYGGVLRPIGAAGIGSDGTDFLVVSETLGFVAATRISPSGTAYAPSIRVADISNSFATPSCAAVWTGAHYVVIWNTVDGIMVRRVSREGQLLDAEARKVATTGRVNVAWNGHRLLVVSGGLRYRLLDGDGVPVIAEQLLNFGLNGSAVAASNGTGFLVAAIPGIGGTEVRARPIDAAGVAGSIFPIPFVGGANPAEVVLSSDGRDYLAVILKSNSAGASATLVRADMSTGSPKTLEGTVGLEPLLVWNGHEYAMIWERILFAAGIHDVAGMRIAADGTPIDAQGITIQTNGERVYAVGSNGTETMVIAQDQDDHRASATIFRTLGVDRRDAAILNVPRDQSKPAIATNGVYSLAVWLEGGVFGEIIGPTGELGRVLEIGADSFEESQPAVASNGRDFIVFWQSQSGDVLARRVGVDGYLLDAAPTILGRVTRATQFAATWSGTAYIGVWTSESTVLAAAISAAGSVLTAPNAINPAPAGSADHAAIACESTGCTAAWHASSSNTVRGGIFSIALTAAGTPGGAQITIVDEPSTHTPAVARGWTLFSHQSRLFRARGAVSLLDAESVFFQPPAGAASRVIVTQRDAVYFTESSGLTSRLLFARIAADGSRTGTIEVDPMLPEAAISAAQRLFVIYTTRHPELGGDRLMLRTLATPDPMPVTPRRRAVR